MACPVRELANCTQVHAAGPTPAPRGGHAAVSVGTKVILYGGTDRQATPFTDLWVLETGEASFCLACLSGACARTMRYLWQTPMWWHVMQPEDTIFGPPLSPLQRPGEVHRLSQECSHSQRHIMHNGKATGPQRLKGRLGSLCLNDKLYMQGGTPASVRSDDDCYRTQSVPVWGTGKTHCLLFSRTWCCDVLLCFSRLQQVTLLSDVESSLNMRLLHHRTHRQGSVMMISWCWIP